MWSRVGAEVARLAPAPGAAPATGKKEEPPAPATKPAPPPVDEAPPSRCPPSACLPALSWTSFRTGSASGGKGKSACAPGAGCAAAATDTEMTGIIQVEPACAPGAASSSGCKDDAAAGCAHGRGESSDNMDSDDDEFGPHMFGGPHAPRKKVQPARRRTYIVESDSGDSSDGGEQTGSDAELGTGGTGDDSSDNDTATAQPAPAHHKQQRPLYKAAGVSTAVRLNVEDSARRESRKARPSHAEYALQQCASTLVRSLVIDSHKCHNHWEDHGEEVECHHQLWARSIPGSVDVLRKARTDFLALGTKERGNAVLAALAFDESNQLHRPGVEGGIVWRPPISKVLYRVGPTPDRQRTVCRFIFLAHYPVSLATLKRIVQRKRLGAELYSKLGYELRKERINVKTLHVIAWTLEYAKQVPPTRLPPLPKHCAAARMPATRPPLHCFTRFRRSCPTLMH